ncbi:Protein of unknown function DUF2085, transmembrane [Desulfovibrio sp. X2]|uniref:DUF2085 domain-containing protein n=1 Tax=Desulfovibrio sp. X2 TaxID=941449 RepID=UPI000358A059|nr:DUF2085 domain-containing protein [Desulfovibrio sp. X2]EPR44497.1 Protein of unknown function DUF2085, transmembrane [Desulfovibrio sp. X2]
MSPCLLHDARAVRIFGHARERGAAGAAAHAASEALRALSRRLFPDLPAALLTALPALAAWGLVLASLAAPVMEIMGLPASASVYAALHRFCHQLPSRCLFLGDSNLGLCERCFALYAAMALCSLPALLGRPRRLARPLPPPALALGLLPCLLDGLASDVWGGPWTSTTASRLVTGALAGSVISLFLYPRYRVFLTALFRDRPLPILNPAPGERP